MESSTTTSKARGRRSEEHTSELQSRLHLVCRLLLEKKKKKKKINHNKKTKTYNNAAIIEKRHPQMNKSLSQERTIPESIHASDCTPPPISTYNCHA